MNRFDRLTADRIVRSRLSVPACNITGILICHDPTGERFEFRQSARNLDWWRALLTLCCRPDTTIVQVQCCSRGEWWCNRHRMPIDLLLLLLPVVAVGWVVVGLRWAGIPLLLLLGLIIWWRGQVWWQTWNWYRFDVDAEVSDEIRFVRLCREHGLSLPDPERARVDRMIARMENEF